MKNLRWKKRIKANQLAMIFVLDITFSVTLTGCLFGLISWLFGPIHGKYVLYAFNTIILSFFIFLWNRMEVLVKAKLITD